MKFLFFYLKNYWKLCVLILFLAIINQVFSLLDPLIFQKIVDTYATNFAQYSLPEFLKGVSFMLFLIIAVAFVSRVAKNFQDYYLNTVTQRIGAQLYALGVKHSLSLPYQIFEDQRSGETLGVLQKVRTDVEKFIGAMINVVFISLIGFVCNNLHGNNLVGYCCCLWSNDSNCWRRQLFSK